MTERQRILIDHLLEYCSLLDLPKSAEVFMSWGIAMGMAHPIKRLEPGMRVRIKDEYELERAGFIHSDMGYWNQPMDINGNSVVDKMVGQELTICSAWHNGKSAKAKLGLDTVFIDSPMVAEILSNAQVETPRCDCGAVKSNSLGHFDWCAINKGVGHGEI